MEWALHSENTGLTHPRLLLLLSASRVSPTQHVGPALPPGPRLRRLPEGLQNLLLSVLDGDSEPGMNLGPAFILLSCLLLLTQSLSLTSPPPAWAQPSFKTLADNPLGTQRYLKDRVKTLHNLSRKVQTRTSPHHMPVLPGKWPGPCGGGLSFQTPHPLWTLHSSA